MAFELTAEQIRNFKPHRIKTDKVFLLHVTHPDPGGQLLEERLTCFCNSDIFKIQDMPELVFIAQCYLCNNVYVLRKNHWLAYPKL